jgi:hexosaminidase
MKSQAKHVILCWVLALVAEAASGATPAIIPLPQQMQTRPGAFTLCPAQPIPGPAAQAMTKILVDGASQHNGQYLAALLLKSTGYQFEVRTNAGLSAVKGAIVLTTVNALTNLGAEGYELTVAPDSVVIRAPAQAGVFYGVQSLLQLLPPQILAPRPVQSVQWTVPCVYIQDQPRFAWRGVMLDVVRHFFTKDEVKRVLDDMALHKLNTFHWHLVDDQGWRVEILKYPLLTQVGAWRNGIDFNMNSRASTAFNSSGNYGGYYTQDDIREVVAYAQQRFITIVPEVEMPGHSTAGVAAYPQYSCSPGFPYSMDTIDYHYDVYSPGTAGTFQFLEDILTEVIGLFPGQYIHTGGDEVSSTIWKTNVADVAQMRALGINPSSSSAVQQYQSWFSGQIANFLQSKGRTLIGWTEIEYGGVLTNAAVMDWITGAGSEAVATASAKQYVVMSPNTNAYINYYETTNLAVEPYFNSQSFLTTRTVYNFEPVPAGLAAQYTPYILGAQCNLWGEYVPSLLNVEFKLFPRMCALAETTWTQPSLKDYTNFTQRLVTHQKRLAQMGVNYDHESIPQIGSWSPANITTYGVTLTWDITSNIAAAGEIDVSFWYTSGANGLNIASVTLLENGIPIDSDVHAGFTGSSQTIPVYVLHLPARKPGATYAIQASVAGRGGTASSGNVYLPNWN